MSAIRKNPKLSNSYGFLGQMYIKTGRPEEALVLFAKTKKYITLSEASSLLFPKAVKAYLALKDQKVFEYMMSKLSELEIIATAYDYRIIGVCLNKAGECKEAVKSFSMAIDILDSDYSLYNFRAEAYEKLGMPKRGHYDRMIADRLKNLGQEEKEI